MYLDYLGGKVKIDEYITHHRKFDEINEGFHDMHVRSPIFLSSTMHTEMNYLREVIVSDA